jgi:hypothetical protein
MGTQPGRPKGAEILKEPFGENTRGHRKSLVAVSAISIFISLTGWFPTEISAIGLKIGIQERVVFLWGLIISIFYFLASFLIHFWPEAVYRDARIYSHCQIDDEQVGFPWQIALVSYAARNPIYLIFPLLISGIALVCLFWISLSPGTSSILAKCVLWAARVFTVGFMIYVGAVLFMFSFEAIGPLIGIFRASRTITGKAKSKDNIATSADRKKRSG